MKFYQLVDVSPRRFVSERKLKHRVSCLTSRFAWVCSPLRNTRLSFPSPGGWEVSFAGKCYWRRSRAAGVLAGGLA